MGVIPGFFMHASYSCAGTRVVQTKDHTVGLQGMSFYGYALIEYIQNVYET